MREGTESEIGKSDFYIVLRGKVSVWMPVKPPDIIQPLLQFKEKIRSTINSGTIPKNIDEMGLKFHIEPIEVDRRPEYCNFKQFKRLCSDKAPREQVVHLWWYFQLHRAVETIHQVEQFLLVDCGLQIAPDPNFYHLYQKKIYNYVQKLIDKMTNTPRYNTLINPSRDKHHVDFTKQVHSTLSSNRFDT